MEVVLLLRQPSTDHGTFGSVYVDGKKEFHSIELPDRNNARNFSCIPTGSYRCTWHKSPRFGWCYLVTGVEGRSFILQHAANYGGDRKKGFKSDLNGCIGLGLRKGWLGKQRAILASRIAVRNFNRMMEKRTFMLIVVEI